MNVHAIAARAADLIDAEHWAAETLRSAFSYAAFGAGSWPRPAAGTFPDYVAIMAFELDWVGPRQHRNDGCLVSETAADRARRVGAAQTVAALREFAAKGEA